jgi:hypothetical protein
MLGAWSREGMAPSDFWAQTLRTFVIIMDGRRRARSDRHAERMESAWTAAALRLQGVKLQSLESLITPKKPIPEQSPDDHLTILKTLANQDGVVMNFRLVKTREELDAEIAALEAGAP